jgi:hypothetical protein
MNTHKGFKRYWIRFLIASYNVLGWARGKFLSAAIRAADTGTFK